MRRSEIMGWPNNFVQGVYNSGNELVGVDDGAGGAILFGGQSLSSQTSTTLAITSDQIGVNILYTGSGAAAWTITGGATIGATFGCSVENRGANGYSCVTITPTAGTINGLTAIVIPYGKGLNIYGDGSTDLKASFFAGLVADNTAFASSAIPMVLLPNCTIAVSGALSALATALPADYTGGFPCYTYWAANTLWTSSGGNAAGFYYTTMANISTGTVYNNLYVSGAPTIPASPTAITGTGAIGAVTQATGAGNKRTAFTKTIGANTLGVNGGVEMQFTLQYLNSATSKGYYVYLGSSALVDNNATTSAFVSWFSKFNNRGVANKQIAFSTTSTSLPVSGGSGVPATLSENTATDLALSIQMMIGAATDYNILNAYTIKLIS